MNTTAIDPSAVLLNNLLDSVTNATIYGTVTYTTNARRVRLFVVVNGHIREITGAAAAAHRFSIDKKGLLVRGSGFCAVQHFVDIINVRRVIADESVERFDAQSLGGAL